MIREYLVGVGVNHKTLGYGMIIDINETHVHVVFDDGTKEFARGSFSTYFEFDADPNEQRRMMDAMQHNRYATKKTASLFTEIMEFLCSCEEIHVEECDHGSKVIITGFDHRFKDIPPRKERRNDLIQR